MTDKDGRWLWIEAKGICIRDELGPYRITGTQRDISDRKRTEEALRESEQLLEASFSQLLDGFTMMLDQPVQWDDMVDKNKVLDYVFAHQRIAKVNDALLAQYGDSREQFIGVTPNDFFAHNIGYGKDVWKRFFDAGRLHIDTDERKVDDTPIWIEGNYICLHDAQGRIIGHFGVQREISDAYGELRLRKRAEAALQRWVQVESLLSSISRQFIDQDVDTAINFTGVDECRYELLRNWNIPEFEIVK